MPRSLLNAFCIKSQFNLPITMMQFILESALSASDRLPDQTSRASGHSYNSSPVTTFSGLNCSYLQFIWLQWENHIPQAISSNWKDLISATLINSEFLIEGLAFYWSLPQGWILIRSLSLKTPVLSLFGNQIQVYPLFLWVLKFLDIYIPFNLSKMDNSFLSLNFSVVCHRVQTTAPQACNIWFHNVFA